MSKSLSISGAIAMALAFSATLFGANGSGAVAQDRIPQIAAPAAAVEPEISPNPAEAAPVEASPVEAPEAAPVFEGRSLAERVALRTAAGRSEDLSRDLECLAGAIYFEAKSESLEGQLAVGRVIVNRSRSGRFPTSYCGVVFQPSQFSFVRGKAMPAINRASHDWKTAVAIAEIAHDGSWASTAEGALFFHAARVSPGWRLTRIARVDGHVFYR